MRKEVNMKEQDREIYSIETRFLYMQRHGFYFFSEKWVQNSGAPTVEAEVKKKSTDQEDIVDRREGPNKTTEHKNWSC